MNAKTLGLHNCVYDVKLQGLCQLIADTPCSIDVVLM